MISKILSSAFIFIAILLKKTLNPSRKVLILSETVHASLLKIKKGFPIILYYSQSSDHRSFFNLLRSANGLCLMG